MVEAVAGDAGLFGPGSVAWRLHADPVVLIGGLRALLIQALHPLAMAGVDQHSDYKDDPWGRLNRTSQFVSTAIFGSTDEAKAAGAVVRRVHRKVKGIDPVTGDAYRAGDPELLLWIHDVLVESCIVAYRRYGPGLSDEDADRYVAEMVAMAELVGTPTDMVPTTLAGVRAHLRSMDPVLRMTPAARNGLRVVLAPPMHLALRPLWVLPTSAAVALLPFRVRFMYRLPWFPPADLAVRATTMGLFTALRLAAPEAPMVRAARQRAA